VILPTTYLLIIRLEKSRRIRIGRLGRFTFEKGDYCYVGSAKRNLVLRIERHLRKKKKKFWHIDYLLQYAIVKKIWISDGTEEELAGILSKKLEIPVLGFGSSDKKSRSHLFYGRITRFDPYGIKIFITL
jgi:Uri superfamily endonuclease